MSLEANPRGIPRAPFVASVPEFLNGDSHEQILLKFQEMIQKYRFMETHLLQRELSLESKIPEIKKSKEMVEYLRLKKEPTVVDFELNDTLWCKSKISPQNSVNLWLGANVMLEYPIDEAIDLLNGKLESAHASMKQTKEDLEYLKEQITTMEVNMARVYNDDVKNRKGK